MMGTAAISTVGPGRGPVLALQLDHDHTEPRQDSSNLNSLRMSGEMLFDFTFICGPAAEFHVHARARLLSFHCCTAMLHRDHRMTLIHGDTLQCEY